MVTVEELRIQKKQKELEKKMKRKKKKGKSDEGLDDVQAESLPAYPYCPRCRMLILADRPGGRNCRSCGSILEGITLPMTHKEYVTEKKRLETRSKQSRFINMKDIKGDVKW